jgi:hypothetical protein
MPSVEIAPSASVHKWLQRYLVSCCAIACGLLWGFELAPLIAAPMGVDQAWDLYAANAVLHGVTLNGPRLIETNPPFLIWFFSLPALLAKALHISLAAGFRVFWTLTITGLIAWSASLYRRVFRTSTLGMWLFVLCAMFVATVPITLGDRGQREYFTAFLLLPYILWASSRLRNIALPFAETFIVAISAAVGVCLKPQHVLDVVAVELLVLIRLRSLRRWFAPALIAVVAGPVLYLLAVRIFAPLYLRDILPLLVETYWGFNKTWSAMAHTAMKHLIAFAVAIMLFAVLRRRLRIEPFIACLLAAATGALLAYVQQHKGWYYHLLTLEIFSYFAVYIICCDIAERMWLEWGARTHRGEAGHLRTPICIALAVLAFVIAVPLRFRHLQPLPYSDEREVRLAAIYSEYPPGTAVDLLAETPWEWPEVLVQNKVWASCYNHLWPLPAIVRSQDPLDTDRAHHLSSAKIAELSSLLRRTTAEDLAHWTPTVVVIEEPCCDPDIRTALSRIGYSGLLDWFERDPQFRDQWSHYRYQKSVGDMRVYTRLQ